MASRTEQDWFGTIFRLYNQFSQGVSCNKMTEKNPLNLIWVMPAKGREKKGFGSCSRSLFFVSSSPKRPDYF